MNKVFLNLISDESVAIEAAFNEEEHGQWIIEKTDHQCQLCGYFEGDFQAPWNRLQQKIPWLKEKVLQCETISDCDWQNEYKKFLTPFRIDCLHIVPIWERGHYSIPDGQFGVYLDAEMAFGTGAHETTKLCLARIVDYRNLFKNSLFLKKMIDVGCGSGILSIAAAKLGLGKVYGFDIDSDAVKISEKNARENGVPSIEFKTADIGAGILGRQADLVVANILAPMLMKNASVLVNTVRQYGILSLSGILNEEMESIKSVFTPIVERYWNCSICNIKTMGQWSEIAYVRT